MSGLRFVFGTFQETEGPLGPSSKEIENTLSNLSSQTIEPVVDTPAQEPTEASIPFWVWFLLIPVVLPLFLLLFRGKGAHRPVGAVRRLDLRTQPEGAKYRERITPVLAKPDSMVPVNISETDPDSATEPAFDPSLDSSLDTFDDEFEGSDESEFDEEVGVGPFRSHSAAPKSTVETSPSPVFPSPSTPAAVQDTSGRLSEELTELRKELATVLARFEESRVNDKLPHLEQELELSHERFRQTELQRKALANELEESNLRNQSLSSEIDSLQAEVETLESRTCESNETAQKLDAARQELESLTQKSVAMEQVLQQAEQVRTKLNKELQLERSARNDLAERCENLESKVADTSATDALAAQVKALESENQSLENRLGQLQDAHDSLARQMADAQVQLSESHAQLELRKKESSPSNDDSRESAIALKLAEKRKLLARVQAKLREKLELIEQLKKQIADSSPV